MKKINNKDPFAAREAEKYLNPVPSREFILQYLKQQTEPLSLKACYQAFKIKSELRKEAMRRRLIAMVRDGQLEVLQKKYWPIEQKILISGTLYFDKRGMLWCTPADGGARFLVVSQKDLKLHGCQAIVSVANIADLTTAKGQIVELIKTTSLKVTGRFIASKTGDYVIPHGKDLVQDIAIPKGRQKSAQDGDIVVVEVEPESTWHDVSGNIIKVIGHENTKGIEIDAAIHAHNLSYQWNAEAATEIAKITAKKARITSKARIDLRALPLVTIDGEDAKDFDDAVFCSPTKSGGWKLYVAIADVSYYVAANSHLDKEAKLRGNSVYFPGKVVPMLPEILSNELCSLLPNQDRLCLVSEMLISKEGKVTRYKFYEGIICSKARLTYTKVAKILAGESKHLLASYKDLVEHLKNLQALYMALQKQRQQRGALDFATVETKIIFDNLGKIQAIEPVTRNIAHKIIEECMLCANVAAAKFLQQHKLPGLYRVHEGPTADKLADLVGFLTELGIRFPKKGKPSPIDYANLLAKLNQRPDAHIIQIMLLRSLCQAVYSAENLGHFGLAFPAYTHFTSPIRRYPDLLVHRQIKLVLHNKWQINKTAKTLEYLAKQQEIFKELGYHCSSTERVADEATRDVELWLKCQYMAKQIGKSFSGTISGVNSFGFFVELTGIFIDGLVHINSLRDDYYIYNHLRHQLLGERTHKQYTLGLPVTVIINKVNIEERKIDFILEAEQLASKKPKFTKKRQRQQHKKTNN